MSKDNLRPEDLDQLGQALITLTQELWVMKDRVRVLETALTDAGVITADTIDSFQPDAALQKTLGKERAQLIEQVLGALERQDP
jgi:mRNA-degrading endonuclease toxin of MazEF toxin-antitoxin module